ncbi:MAG: hypothetical protein H6729_04515 [Deltaproteobacteria bacterium]|nr:hypothetical protein [Deltaproteobacteria bacterium]
MDSSRRARIRDLWILALLVFAAGSLASCMRVGLDVIVPWADGGSEDRGLGDGWPSDGTLDDAGLSDAGPDDIGRGDAGPDDIGLGDAGPDDIGLGDAGPDDAGVRDGDAGENVDAADDAGDAGGSVDSGDGAIAWETACELGSVGAYYVATTGDDVTGTGSMANPWASIGHALAAVPDESVILVQRGTYSGRIQIARVFPRCVVVRSETPYAARLTADRSEVITCFECGGVAFEGFNVSNDRGALDGREYNVIHVSDLIGPPGGVERAGRFILRNSVVHDSASEVLFKANNGSAEVLVEGNIFYNAGKAGAEQLSLISVSSARVIDNVFFDDFEGSGRPVDETTGPHILIGAGSDPVPAEDIVVRGNVFFRFEGSQEFGFVQIGNASFGISARNVLVENNLLMGDDRHPMKTPFDIQGVEHVRVRHNTTTGVANAQDSGFRVQPGEGPTDNVDLSLVNNVWVSGVNTMTGFAWVSSQQTTPILLVNNLYYNAGAPVPFDGTSIVNAQDDPRPHWDDPRLPILPAGGLTSARWVSTEMLFSDPEGLDNLSAIDDVRRRLVEHFGTPAAGSALTGVADSAESPADDILGNPRPTTEASDIGAVELP